MKYKLTKAEQETVINFDNELDTASIYTHDSRLIKKLRELRKQYPEQFILEHREHGSVTYTIPKRCVGILSLIHISEPTRLGMISYAVFCLKKKKKTIDRSQHLE